MNEGKIRLRIGIVGGGIGGLALAHGLIRNGFSVRVFEQNAVASDTGGYRLHLTEESLDALKHLLPTNLSAAIESSAAPPETFRHLAIFDRRANCRARLLMPKENRLLIGRRPLRELLARGLDEAIRWNTRVEQILENDECITMTTGSGETEEFDIVVGADGTGSVVTQALLGRPAARPSGVAAIAGTVFLNKHPDLKPPVALEKGLGLAIGPKGVGMFMALHIPRTTDVAPGAIEEEPYLVWSVIAQVSSFSADIIEMSRKLMKEESVKMIAPWTSFHKNMIEKTEANTLAAFNFVFPGSMIPWPQSRLTLIGDAVHPMPPTAGAGASTAIIDALNLVNRLSTQSWPSALEEYQKSMLEYAPKAVDLARPALEWQIRLGNPVLRWIALNLGLPVVDIALRLINRN